MNMLQAIYNDFRSLVSSGQLCKGDRCPGWFISDVDTAHQCPCGAGYHWQPEADFMTPASKEHPIYATFVNGDHVAKEWASTWPIAKRQAREFATENKVTTTIRVLTTEAEWAKAFPEEAASIGAFQAEYDYDEPGDQSRDDDMADEVPF